MHGDRVLQSLGPFNSDYQIWVPLFRGTTSLCKRPLTLFGSHILYSNNEEALKYLGGATGGPWWTEAL
jgi:hypothetical protein